MEKLLEIFSMVLRVPKNKLSLEISKAELKSWDSLAHLQLISEIEEKFNISIPFEDIPNLKKIGDFAKYIKE